MLERIKQGDMWLYKFVLIVMVVLCAVALIIVTLIMSLEGDFRLALIPIGSAVVLCGGLYLNYFISGLFYLSACDKGYDSVVFSRIPFFLGAVGYILICALPDRGGVKSEENDDELPEL